ISRRTQLVIMRIRRSTARVARAMRSRREKTSDNLQGDTQGTKVIRRQRSVWKISARLSNAHDLDPLMSFFPGDCVLPMPRGLYPWAVACLANSKLAKVWRRALRGLPDVNYGNATHLDIVCGDVGISEPLPYAATQRAEPAEVQNVGSRYPS